VREIEFQSACDFRAVIAFPFSNAIEAKISSPQCELIFAARSRISRLGISLRPVTAPLFSEREISFEVAGRLLIRDAGIERHLSDAFLPGTNVGRMVLCDQAKRLSSAAVNEALERNQLKLPGRFTLGSDGRVTFPSQLCRYRFRFELRLEHLVAVLRNEDGKDLLNFLQVRETVQRILLPAGGAVITACTMFLDHHFFVLDTGDTSQGKHFHARVLDPTETRMSNAFLEFENDHDYLIVNPSASGYLFEADQVVIDLPSISKSGKPHIATQYSQFEDMFLRIGKGAKFGQDYDRQITLLHENGKIEDARITPIYGGTESPIALLRNFESVAGVHPAGAGDSLLCSYFPNAREHPAIVCAATEGQFRNLIFRLASYERGPFLSERDHMRMIDYSEIGIDVMWLNEVFEQMGIYFLRNRRGYFVNPNALPRFQDALLIGVYGSTMDLPNAEAETLSSLITELAVFFGSNVGFITGGGGGVMRLVLETGRRAECLVGSNFLENADQNLDKTIDFYQTFQSGARHLRQRWFEVARCHLFSIGGVGTLEEIGMTLTDIKLGLMNTDPVILFGSSAKSAYWKSLGQQLKIISDERRGPEWLATNVLVTADVAEAMAFYKRILQVG
jgi:predicted Rossmann-fold nucleotide-binding protein